MMKISIKTMLASAMVALMAFTTACSSTEEAAKQKDEARVRQETAMRMWQERCQQAGEKIYKTIDDIDGIFLIKTRSYEAKDHYDQFKMSDPYGRDLFGEGYISSFMKGFNTRGLNAGEDLSARKKGYLFVDANDPKLGTLHRYTPRIEEPWQFDKSYLKGYTRLVMDSTPITAKQRARYGITYEDISTRQERDYWIAGSSLRVIDMETGELIAERIGYMVDWAQGSTAGGRAPWLFAADNACPAFPERRGSVGQADQTYRFVEKVLKPKSINRKGD